MFSFVTKMIKALAVKHLLVHIFDPSRRPLIHRQVRRREIRRVIKVTGWRLGVTPPPPPHLKNHSYALVLIRVKNVVTFSCYDSL